MENRSPVEMHRVKALATILAQRLQLAQQNDATLEEWKDFNDVCHNLVSRASDTEQKALLGDRRETRDEVTQWLTFANTFQSGDLTPHTKLQSVDEHLSRRAVLAGKGITITVADIAAFVSMHDAVTSLPPTEQEKLPNLIRWFDYVQNKVNVTLVFQNIPIRKANFEPVSLQSEAVKKPAKPVQAGGPMDKVIASDLPSNREDSTGIDKTAYNGKSGLDENLQTVSTTKDALPEDNAKAKQKKGKEEKPLAQKKDKEEKPAVQKKDVDVNVSALDIRIGIVKKVWKHPSADSLLVEEIDFGEYGVRQVVSGLAKYITEQEMLNRRVVVIVNVKPGKLRDVTSSGLVLCASNQDHSSVEPLVPPESSVVGERVTFTGHDGKPEDVLNPKKKQLEKILPDLLTDATGIATYQGVPFMTSAGPCKSAIAKGTIK